MGFYVLRDDELDASQTHTVIGDEAGLERDVGISHVHQDVGPRPFEPAHVFLPYLERNRSEVDLPLIAFGAGNGHSRPMGETLGRSRRAHHRGNPELPRHDGRVTRAAAAAGHDGGGLLHHRLPVRGGGVGDQDLARLELAQSGDARDHPGLARSDPGPDRAACE